MNPLHLGCLVLLLPGAGTDSDTADAGWPHLRGPAFNGHISSSVFEERDFALDLAWKVPIGSGYSGVAIADGAAVTMFSDGENDVVAALDVETGAERWRHVLGPKYPGHDGSADGPISTPVVQDDLVFALGPRGTLVALSLSSGRALWSHDLVKDFGARAPDYGFTTTPVVDGDVVIVQLGGPDGRSLGGLDTRTGALRWSTGDEEVGYQSPALMTLADRRQLVVFRGNIMAGHDPRTGNTLWEHELGSRDGASSAIPTPLDEHRFFAQVGSGLIVFEVKRTDDGFAVEEVMRSREFGNTYTPPVRFGDHYYGFRRDFLTCVDANTGKRVWRSRPPGGKGLILVNDKLVIFGAQGRVVVAAATPEGYQEEAALEVFDGSGFTWPSFADGKIFLRTPRDLAAVSVVKKDQVKSGRVVATESIDSPFTRWIDGLKDAEDRSQQVEDFLARQDTIPIVEGDVVHFIYHGDAEDVAISGTMMDASRPDPLIKIDGTDVHYRSYKLAPGSRVEYRYQIDLDRWEHDARNPRTVPGGWGDQRLSVVALSGYEHPTHIDEPAPGSRRGRVETFSIPGWDDEQEREITVYLPAAYDSRDSDRFPLLIVQEGPSWMQKGLMVNSLDNLIGNGVAPVVVAFLDTIGPWWLEAGGSDTGRFADWVAEKLVGDLEGRYRLETTPDARAIIGARDYGLSAMVTAFQHPEVIGKAAAQSPGMRNGAQLELAEMMKRRPRADLDLYVDWNLYEARSIDQDFDHGADARALADALKKNGYDFAGGQAQDSHGWGGWRARTDEMLETLFPLAGGR